MFGEENMSQVTYDTAVSSKRLWAGRIISALAALLLLFSGAMKLLKAQAVIVGMTHYGYPEHLILYIGILEVACTIVYLIPRTAILGAVLMTAYLGGATATNVRVGDPSFIGPVMAGVFVWAGLYLRDARLAALIPVRR
jgi:DoxX-like family